MQNFQVSQANKISEGLKSEFIEQQVAQNNAFSGANIADKKALEAQYKVAQDLLKVQKGLTIEQQQQYIEIQKKVGLNTQEIELILNRKELARQLLDDEEATLTMAQARKNIEIQTYETQKKQQAIYRQNLLG